MKYIFTTEEMIKALASTNNILVRKMAKRIIEKETTIEEELKMCGGFMKKVFAGDYTGAFGSADVHNKAAILRYLHRNRHTEIYLELYDSYYGHSPDQNEIEFQ